MRKQMLIMMALSALLVASRPGVRLMGPGRGISRGRVRRPGDRLGRIKWDRSSLLAELPNGMPRN
jgi:hypothetical protein